MPDPVPGDGSIRPDADENRREQGEEGSPVSATVPDTEFIALWNRPDLSAQAIAEKLNRTPRAVTKRANNLHLPAKGMRATRSMKIRAQLVEAAMPAADGVPDPRTPWLADADIRPVFEEYWARLKATNTGEDLVRLRPLQLKLHAMIAAKYPWAVDCLQTLAESSKLTLYAQKVEADMPQKNDPAVLRQEAGRQMMEECASVLDRDEQKALGILLQTAAKRLAAKRGTPLITHTAGSPQQVASPTPEMVMARTPETAGAPGSQTTVLTPTSNVPGAKENPW